eukprot:2557041-Amphidinium_carterae.1
MSPQEVPITTTTSNLGRPAMVPYEFIAMLDAVVVARQQSILISSKPRFGEIDRDTIKLGKRVVIVHVGLMTSKWICYFSLIVKSPLAVKTVDEFSWH